MAPALTFVNARLSDGALTGLRIEGRRIAEVGCAPRGGDRVVDLDGARLLPGLINAHDHLHLNSVPGNTAQAQYRDVRDWIADVNALRRTDADFDASVTLARDERLFMGGLKNLLSGVTCVAHHDRFYPALAAADFPVPVLRDYGWSHSLYAEDEVRVVASHAGTPHDWPWMIHAAEGLEHDAATEFDRLDDLGCLSRNTVIVHGIAMDASQRARLTAAGAALVWCPSSNLHLFGSTAQLGDILGGGRVALGSDSRLSGARDLLDDLRVAHTAHMIDEATLEALVTRNAARILRLTDRGDLRPGLRADLLVIPAASRLSDLRRSDILLLLIDGTARYGNAALAEHASPQTAFSDVRVDGAAKVLERSIAQRAAHTGVCETGLELSAPAWRAA
jgi:cytosine/adenosine deaminase-related metal-dependent hydrolase